MAVRRLHEDDVPELVEDLWHLFGEVYVVQDRRGEGIAGELMDRAERWADDRDYEYVTLSVNADNETGRNVYGSREYETRRHKMDKRLE